MGFPKLPRDAMVAAIVEATGELVTREVLQGGELAGFKESLRAELWRAMYMARHGGGYRGHRQRGACDREVGLLSAKPCGPGVARR